MSKLKKYMRGGHVLPKGKAQKHKGRALGAALGLGGGGEARSSARAWFGHGVGDGRLGRCRKVAFGLSMRCVCGLSVLGKFSVIAQRIVGR